MPLYFIENRGQLDGSVAFYVQGLDKTVYFTPQGLTFALQSTSERAQEEASRNGLEKLRDGLPSFQPAAWREPGQSACSSQAERVSEPHHRGQRWVVKLDFVGANPRVQVHGQDATGATINYFKGQQGQWRTGLKTWGTLVYEDLWPGIDLVYAGTANRLKYHFLVKPGADPQQIRLAYRGATSVTRNKARQLEVATPVGGFQDEIPVAYQEVNEQRVGVKAAFALGEKSSNGTQGYGFEVGAYDKSKVLVLDPAVIVYCGYIGGGSSEAAFGVAVDNVGSAYVTGITASGESSFPVKAGPDLTYNGGNPWDVFVAKIKADGTGLVYCGYIGSNVTDLAGGIAVDGFGNAYVVGTIQGGTIGFTFDPNSFPASVGPDLTYNGGAYEAFVAKVKADGGGLDYCGYIGGAADDFATGIALDSAGSAYISGYTDSTQSTFPVSIGPDLTFNGGMFGDRGAGYDAFVAKVKADGIGLAYCGYIGGTDYDLAQSIAVDASGNAYIAGYTVSNQGSFPVTVGPYLTFRGGDRDAFVAKVRADATGLVYCGYIGGNLNEEVRSIAIDSSGNAYVAGYTNSSQSSFPVTVGPGLTFNDPSGSDAFVAKIRTDGTGLDYCGYIGGAGGDIAYAIAVDAAGNAYVAGDTGSNQSSFPVIVGPDLTHNGDSDAFVAKIRTDGAGFVYCGYIGGTGTDLALAIAVDSARNAYVVGLTQSEQTSFPVIVGPDQTFNSPSAYTPISDAFITKVSSTQACAPPDISSINPPSPTVSNTDQTVIVSGTNFKPGLTLTATFPDGTQKLLSGTQIQDVVATAFKLLITLGSPGDWGIRINDPDCGQSSEFTFKVRTGKPPILSASPVRFDCGRPFDWVVNKPLVFTMSATAGDPGSLVTLNATGIPTGASLRPLTPISGNPVSTTFSWMPTLNQGGRQTVVFSARDNTGLQSQCSAIIDVKVDSDGDGLPDDWETKGYTFNGRFVNLPMMGANPNHKDIFVEIDYMEGHRPDEVGVLDKIRATFSRVPNSMFAIPNPDGADGVSLHIRPDEQLAHRIQLGTNENDVYFWTAFDNLKRSHFEEALSLSHHYCIFAHNGPLSPNGRSYSGIARAIPSSDFLVTLGSWPRTLPTQNALRGDGEGGSDSEQAGTFMHELGHNLGLCHGGPRNRAEVDDQCDVNYKPNYLSVMNYSFQFSGLRVKGVSGFFDYSRFALPPLVEMRLNEGVGLNGGPAINGYGTIWFCGSSQKPTDNANDVINWNCDKSFLGSPIIENDVAANINGPKESELTTLFSYNDWANLNFKGGLIGAGAIFGLPLETTNNEIDIETAKSIMPFPPTGLTARFEGCVARLNWMPTGPIGEYSYKVYRSAVSIPFTMISSTTSTSMTDLSIDVAKTYAYYVIAVNTHGSGSEPSATAIVKGAADLITEAISLVRNFNINSGLKNSLVSKLENALQSVNRGNRQAACNQVNAFINELRTQSGKELTASHANQLIAAANQIATIVCCQ